jgi:hypothetical protein
MKMPRTCCMLKKGSAEWSWLGVYRLIIRTDLPEVLKCGRDNSSERSI